MQQLFFPFFSENMETTPTLSNARIIRTYATDYAGSDTGSGSEVEVEYEDTEDNEEEVSIATRLGQNQRYIDEQIALPVSSLAAWVLKRQTWKATDDTFVELIQKPTASNVLHTALNPMIYRNVQNAGSLNDLAVLLKSPEDWEARYNYIIQDGEIMWKLTSMKALPADTLESEIHARFSSLVVHISVLLRIRVVANGETNLIVGGILARYQYDVRGRCDPHFSTRSGVHLIASEIKRAKVFKGHHMWYHNTRGVQVLMALYAFNAPTFLLSQQHWKLLVENEDRNAILTFPYGDEHSPHVRSAQLASMGSDFVRAIVICLLSNRRTVLEAKAARVGSSIPCITPEKPSLSSKSHATGVKEQKISARLETPSGIKQPSFVSGYCNGLPVYSLVRVLAPDVVANIEDEIAAQEKLQRQATSEMILVE